MRQRHLPLDQEVPPKGCHLVPHSYLPPLPSHPLPEPWILHSSWFLCAFGPGKKVHGCLRFFKPVNDLRNTRKTMEGQTLGPEV